MNSRKKMLNKELQGKYRILMFAAYILSKSFIIKLINRSAKKNTGASIPGFNCSEVFIPGRNGGPDIRTRIFKPLNVSGKLPGMLYIHGGGYITGKPESFLSVIKRFIDARPSVIVSPDYRKALDSPYPAAFEDCYDTLLWLKKNSEKLGVLPDSFIIAGHSAGGGLTAAISLKARDTGDVKIAFQMPIYPMIDDRQQTPSAINNNAPVWNSKSNEFGWNQYLRNLREQQLETPPYAAPARASDYSELPPTITFVGDLEPFRDETIEYVENLKKANIPVEFRLYKGCFHAFEQMVPEAKISKDAWAFVLKAYSDYIDKYIKMEMSV